jgi:hypothetical protein
MDEAHMATNRNNRSRGKTTNAGQRNRKDREGQGMQASGSREERGTQSTQRKPNAVGARTGGRRNGSSKMT